MEPILLDVPAELSTERLMLRIPRPGDGAVINEAIVESAAELAQYMPWARPTPNVAHTETWVRNAAAKFLTRDAFHFLIFLKSTGQYLGTCGMHRMDLKVPWVEIGYWMRTSQCRRGYMTEATKAVAAFALEHLKCVRVEIRCNDRNAASKRVAERCEFKLEGILRNQSRNHHDELYDTCIYALVPPGKN
jgi:ribosomal-protein-serine acetyltransferase